MAQTLSEFSAGRGPSWPVVDRAQPVKVTFSGRARSAAPAADGMARLLVLPDPQIGYRIDGAGVPEAFHDEVALELAVAVGRVVRPDRTVVLGDLLDLPQFGRFRKEPSFALAGQAAVDRAHAWLAAVARLGPVDILEGNHDARLGNWLLDNAAAAFGLRRANAPGDWPALSVPYLLRIDELEGVEYHEGYPANVVYYSSNLAAVHGQKLKLSQVLDDERVCVVQGHTHRAAIAYRQRRTRDGAALHWAASPGCLCRVDGAVPGVNAGLDSRSGRAVDRPQDWHQGVALVTFDPAGVELPVYEFIPFAAGRARWRDHTIEVPPC